MDATALTVADTYTDSRFTGLTGLADEFEAYRGRVESAPAGAGFSG